MRAVRSTFIAAITMGLIAGSTLGVGAQDADPDPIVAVLVTGTEHFTSEWSERTTTSEADRTLIEGVGLTGVWEATDPRLSGEVTYAGTYDRSEGSGFEVEAASRLVTNDGGRWVGTSTALTTAPDTTPRVNTETVLLTGEGAYEGLLAYVIVDSTTDPGTFVAGILPGEMPAPPELPTGSE